MIENTSETSYVMRKNISVIQYRPGKYVLIYKGKFLRKLSGPEATLLDLIPETDDTLQEANSIEVDNRRITNTSQLVDPGMLQVALAITVLGYILGDNSTGNSIDKVASNWLF